MPLPGMFQGFVGSAAPLYTGGSNIGSMTSGGGLAAAFDNALSGGSDSGARALGSSGYVGKDHGSTAIKMMMAQIYPTTVNDGRAVGFCNSGGNITLTLRANTSSPGSASDGTSLGSVTVTGANTNVQTIVSSDQSTQWRYFWIQFTDSIGGASVYTIEVRFYTMFY